MALTHSFLAAAIVTTLSTAALATPTLTISDGDTIKVDGVKIRIIGLDAPETHKKLCDDGDRYRERSLGFKATNYLRKLLHDEPYTIKWHNRQDRYGRELAQVFVRGRDLADIMVGQGLAVRYDCPNYRCKARIDWCDKLAR